MSFERRTTINGIAAAVCVIAMQIASGATLKIPLADGWRFAKGDDPSCTANLSQGNMCAILDQAQRKVWGQFAAPKFRWAERDFDDTGWRPVRVPHDWGVESSFDASLPYGDAYLDVTGVGWYRLELKLENGELRTRDGAAAIPKGGRVYFECDGAMSYAMAYVNGKFAGGWPYGYTRWRIDVTKELVSGRNVIAIRCHNMRDSSRWYTGGGLYRRCRLLVCQEDHVIPGSVFISAPEVAKTQATVRVAYEMSKSGRRERSFTVENPRLWDVDDPYLYEVEVEGDKYRYGIRTISFNADGRRFQLNGRTVPLNGVSMHHDFGVLGAAWNRTAQERRLKEFKEAGVNAIRSAHNPPDEGLLELCDELGLLFKDEVFDEWWIGARDKRANGYSHLFGLWSERDVRSWVRTDRNHPCVIMYSIGNEIVDGYPEFGRTTEEFAADARRLARFVAEEDPTRPAVNANNNSVNFTNDFPRVLPILGCNYYSWQYGEFRRRHPNVPFFASESICMSSTRGEFTFPVRRRWPKAGEVQNACNSSYCWEAGGWSTLGRGWACPPDVQWHYMDAEPSCMGEFVWTGVDYLGGPYWCEEWKRPLHTCNVGFLDSAGFRKDSFWLFQSRWRPDLHMAHILPHWNWKGREGKTTPVYVFTSGDEAELFLNGNSLGRRRKNPSIWHEAYRLCWDDVRYEPGELRVVAYRDGKEWARDMVQTTGPAVRLELKSEKSAIAADGDDLAFVNVSVRDAEGRVVPRTDATVTFRVEGPGEIIATDNGDERDFSDFHSPVRKVLNGWAQAIVRARRGESGVIAVRAEADGLEAGSVSIKIKGEAKWICETVSPVKPDFDYAKEFYQQDPNAAPGTSCFLKCVRNAKPVLRAEWKVSGLGVFEAYVNGTPAGEPSKDRPRLMPGFTDMRKTKHVFLFDVTHLFKRGWDERNVLSAEVSSGWWRDRIARFYGKRSAFWGELSLAYEDGTIEKVCTDETWLVGDASPVRYAGIFDGEDFDARRSRDWMKTGTEPSFVGATVSHEFKGSMIPLEGPWTRFREDLVLKPVSAYAYRGAEGAGEGRFGKIANVRNVGFSTPVRLAKGETLVVDFGQNCAAVPRFSFLGPAGTTLTALPREMLNDGNGLESRGNDGPEGSVYRSNVRGARATIRYTFSGDGEERYVPAFTYFGYRYLSVSATDDVVIRAVESLPVTSVAESAEGGYLETGSSAVNRLIENIRWGMRSNYLSVPTDCPQRNERLGWAADTQIFAPAATRLADVGDFLSKWMHDMRDTQLDSGSFAAIAPFSQYDEDPDRFGWGDAGIIVPYVVWQRSGDVGIVKKNWLAMKRHMARVANTKHELQPGCFQFADWLSFECYEPSRMTRADRLNPSKDCKDYWNYLGACYWLYDARLMRDMAKGVGETADEAAFADEAERALDHIRGHYLLPSGDLLPAFADMQGANVFALAHGIFPNGAATERGRAALLSNIGSHRGCLQTGFLSTSFLMQALDAADATDVAYTLLLQRGFPSWLYSVDQGATTVWERWNSYTKDNGFGPVSMNSFNHYAYGAVLEWMFATMAGIRPDPAAPGYKRFVLAPRPDRRVGYVKARQRTPQGEITSEWRYEGDVWQWTFSVPPGAEAAVQLPGSAPSVYGPGVHSIKSHAKKHSEI